MNNFDFQMLLMHTTASDKIILSFVKKLIFNTRLENRHVTPEIFGADVADLHQILAYFNS